MIIVLKPNTSKEDETALVREVESRGYSAYLMRGANRVVIGAVGNGMQSAGLETLTSWSQVERITPIQKRFRLVNREAQAERSVIKVTNEVQIGGRKIQIIAGPCSVESETQLMTVAEAVKKSGATLLRGGAFKPRTSPYDFRGLGEKGLKLLAKSRAVTGLPIITECLSEDHVDTVAEYADVIQIGTRNAQNYQLLMAVAKTGKPILLKRGFAMKIEEWLLAGEYILMSGNPRLIFCERGIRTFETYTRNTLDLSAIPILKNETHCPIVIDPSQGCGNSNLVESLCIGAVSMGADGLLIEVHNDPDHARSDGAQQITPEKFAELVKDLQAFIQAANRE